MLIELVSMSKLLVESTAIPVATGKDGRWRAVLLTPGKGSSGTHVEETIRSSGARALRKGAKSFVTHNRLENGEPDPFAMWGFLAEDSHYEDGIGLVGEIEVLPSYRDKIAEVAPHTALSVFVMGNVDDKGVVTEYLEDPQNGADLVVYPGRPGSGLVEKLYEAAKASAVEAENGTATADRKTESEGSSNMEIQDLAVKVDKLTESIATLVAGFSTLTESLKPVEKPAEVADLGAVAEAAVKGGIPEEMRQEIYETVKAMTPTDAMALVESRKKLVDSIAKSIKEAAPGTSIGVGRVVEGAEKKFSLTSIAGA